MIPITKTFKTKGDAQAFVADTLKRWPPDGYGTFLSILPNTGGGFLVTGYRSRSCD